MQKQWSRARRGVAKWFGVSQRDARNVPGSHASEFDVAQAVPALGQIVLITGPSGAGKSVLLRQIWRRYRRLRRRVIDLSDILLPDRPVVDCMSDAMSTHDHADEKHAHHRRTRSALTRRPRRSLDLPAQTPRTFRRPAFAVATRNSPRKTSQRRHDDLR